MQQSPKKKKKNEAKKGCNRLRGGWSQHKRRLEPDLLAKAQGGAAGGGRNPKRGWFGSERKRAPAQNFRQVHEKKGQKNQAKPTKGGWGYEGGKGRCLGTLTYEKKNESMRPGNPRGDSCLVEGIMGGKDIKTIKKRKS